MLNIYYFKDIQGLNDFAHGDVHRKAWEWYERECTQGKNGTGYGYIGVFHEAFEVEKGGWETIAVNMPPTLLGATSVPVKVEGKEEGGEVWVSPLVEARGRVFKGQLDRMGRGKGGE
jgi:fumagillin biosynthesis monooxygenase